MITDQAVASQEVDPESPAPAQLAAEVFNGKSPRDTFVALLAKGFWPVAVYAKGAVRYGQEEPAQGKEPIGKAWGAERWSLERGHSEFKRNKRTGVGICLGPGRGPGDAWLVDIEGDGPGAEDSRRKLLGDDLETLGWVSARGPHCLLTVDPDRIAALLSSLKGFESKEQNQAGVYKHPELPGLELRIGGYKPDGAAKQLQSVVPPTPATDDTPRVWRGPDRIAAAPDSFYSTLEALAPKPTKGGAEPSFAGRAVNWDWTVTATNHTPEEAEAKRLANYAMKALAEEAAKVAGTPEGGRHDALRAASMNMAGFVKAGHLAVAAYMGSLGAAAESSGLPPGETSDLLQSALQIAEPRDMGKAKAWKPESDRNGHHQGNGKPKGPAGGGPKAEAPDPKAAEDEYAGATDAELGIVDGADVVLENPIWLWGRRFLVGKINLVAGEGGDGKTTLAILVGSVVAQGGTFPDGQPAGPPGVVMILAAEDGAGDTIMPRFVANGTDLSKGMVKVLTAAVSIPKKGDRPAMVHPVSLKDTPYWRAVFRRHRPRLLIIDPLPAYLGRGVNDNKNSDVQQALKEFAQLANEFGVCVIAITHTGKATDRKLIHKVLGSVAYTNVARVVHVTVRDPEDPNLRYLERPKCNLDEPADALAYKIVSAEFERGGTTYKTSRAEVDPDPVAIDAEAMIKPKRDGGPARGPDPKKEAAVAEWLFDYLREQATWTERSDVIASAGAAGHIGKQHPGNGKWSNLTALYRGKKRLATLTGDRAGKEVIEKDMKTVRDRYPRWCWRLADQGQEDPDWTPF